eukprot:SM000029S10429  [mRNA]  locus=s29:39204:41673:- [translate_table: standard]
MWAASCLASCCAVCACEACKGLANGVSRKSARLAYCGLFTLSLLLAWALRDYAEPLLSYLPWIAGSGVEHSKEWFGTQAVLRISFGNFLFFSSFALILIGVKDQGDARDGWHHGGWMVKFILWGMAILLGLCLPTGLIGAYGEVARFGSGLFLLVQVVILLDFTYSWNAAWVAKDEQKWYMALLAVSTVCYTAALAIVILLFNWFSPAGHDCDLNVFYLTFTLFLCGAFSVVSLHPQVNGSLLPSSVITLYCTYLAYSALSSEPRKYECNGLAKHLNMVSTSTLVMGVLTTLLSVVYSAVRAGSSTAFLSPPTSPRAGVHREPMLAADGGSLQDQDTALDSDDEVPRKNGKASREAKPVRYVYSFFHVIFALASMYSAMLLTGWGGVGEEGRDIIDVGWPSVWVKISSQWATAALYTWSLVAPILLPDREFS